MDNIIDFKQRSKESNESRLYLEEIPGRKEKLPEFIAMAKRFCNEYEYGLIVREVDHGIILDVSLDSGQYTDSRLNRLIGMTDDIEIETGVNNRDVTLHLRYNVVCICRDGERIFPEILGQ